MILGHIENLASIYRVTKTAFGDHLELSGDLLHVHLGLMIFFVSALFVRRRMRSWWPLAIVFGFALLNEIIDIAAPGPWSAKLGLRDIANTVVWPFVLFVLARRGMLAPARVGR